MLSKTALVLISLLAMSCFAESAPKKHPKPQYIIHAQPTFTTASGVFVEVFANNIWTGDNGFDAWTTFDGAWTFTSNGGTQSGVVSGDSIQIFTTYQVTSFTVGDYLLVSGSPDNQHDVTNAVSVTSIIQFGEYWIDFDSTGAARISTTQPPDFGMWLSDGSPNPSHP